MTYKEQLDKLVQQLLASSQPWFKAGEALALLALTVKAEIEKKTGKPVTPDLDPTIAIKTAYDTGVIHTQAAANLCVLVGKMVAALDGLTPPPPVIIDPPVVPPVAGYTYPYKLKIPGDLGAGAKEAAAYMAYAGPYWTGQLTPVALPTEFMKGTWYGWNHGTSIDPQTGHGGTLWLLNAYNVFGLLEDVKGYKIGDFVKMAEGHFFYVRAVPHLDVMIRRCSASLLGGQGVQREWRNHETALPVDMWKQGGGKFTVEDCQFYETGLIDSVTGGQSPRGSWCLSLYGTMQHTFVRRVVHMNIESPAPHEGSVFIGYGQSGYRTPSAEIDACVFHTIYSDRADIMLQGVDHAVVKNTSILGPDPWIDVSRDCKKLIVTGLPMDCQVREKPADDIHRSPVKVHQYKAGTTLELTLS